MSTTYIYTTCFAGKSVEKILGKTDNSQKMLTPWRAISVNNIAKNTVIYFFSQTLIEAFPLNKFNKTFIIGEKIRKTLKKGVLQTTG